MAEAFGPRLGLDSASTGRARGPLYDRPLSRRSARLGASMVAELLPTIGEYGNNILSPIYCCHGCTEECKLCNEYGHRRRILDLHPYLGW